MPSPKRTHHPLSPAGSTSGTSALAMTHLLYLPPTNVKAGRARARPSRVDALSTRPVRVWASCTESNTVGATMDPRLTILLLVYAAILLLNLFISWMQWRQTGGSV